MHEAEKQARKVSAPPSKEERLAEALRANLAKRKSVQRARKARTAESIADETPGGEASGPKRQEP